MIALIAGFLDSDEGTNVESDDASAYGKLWSRCSRSRHFRCVFCPLRHTPSKARLGENRFSREFISGSVLFINTANTVHSVLVLHGIQQSRIDRRLGQNVLVSGTFSL